ncbi:MAG: hypothetical protein LBE62_15940 [Azonexus sp.]|jgi:hypothetical protein|nr:hypothetical protein [Azonexus sp.]
MAAWRCKNLSELLTKQIGASLGFVNLHYKSIIYFYGIRLALLMMDAYQNHKSDNFEGNTMNFYQRLFCLAPIALFGLLSATDAAACSLNAVTISQIAKSNGGGVVSSQTIDATNCYEGSGNDLGNLTPTANLGYAGDGLLNGEGGTVSPTQFINASQLMDLANDGIANDPGWIFLGSLDGNNGQWSEPVQPFVDISSLLDISMTSNASDTAGTWTVTTVANIFDQMQAALGRDVTFDHLAITLYAANSYVIYDFNLIGAGLDFDTAYSYSGTWETMDFINSGNGSERSLGHMSVWVRSPLPPANQVSAPGTLVLTALGLTLLSLGMRQRQS